MKTLKLQGHEIEYPDEWADDHMWISHVYDNSRKLVAIKVSFYDKDNNRSGYINHPVTQ